MTIEPFFNKEKNFLKWFRCHSVHANDYNGLFFGIGVSRSFYARYFLRLYFFRWLLLPRLTLAHHSIAFAFVNFLNHLTFYRCVLLISFSVILRLFARTAIFGWVRVFFSLFASKLIYFSVTFRSRLQIAKSGIFIYHTPRC